MMKKIRSYQTGFSMIELLVVSSIIILISSIALVSFQTATLRSRNGKREADISQVRSALEVYRATEGTYPVHVNYSGLMANNDFAQFLTGASPSDPKDSTPYVYTYTSDGFTYSICYTLEPDPGTQECLSNP